MNITLYPLGAYVSGYCLPFTIDLDDISLPEFGQAISTGLFETDYQTTGGSVLSSRCLQCKTVFIGTVEKECPCCGHIGFELKCTDEEWIVCDSEDVPSDYVGEYSLSDDFFEYAELIKNTYLDADTIKAGLACGLDLAAIEGAYQGKFDSDADFAEHFAEQTGEFNEKLNWPFTCIDWQWASIDLMHDYTEHKQHYFYRH